MNLSMLAVCAMLCTAAILPVDVLSSDESLPALQLSEAQLLQKTQIPINNDKAARPDLLRVPKVRYPPGHLQLATSSKFLSANFPQGCFDNNLINFIYISLADF